MLGFDLPRWPVAAIAASALLLGLLLFISLVRGLFRPGPRRHLFAPLLSLALALGLLVVGAGATGLLVALSAWQTLNHKTHVAEVQCIELAPERLRLYYVPIARDGSRGATETYDLQGDQWTVGGDIVRFRPTLQALGLETVYRISRVEGRYASAAAARAHHPTAYDRAGGTTRTWLELYRHGARGPLGWLIAGAHGQAVSQLPDRRALYDLYVTPTGLIVDKRAL